ncbi:MAG TPA: hypothetical protein VEH47_00400, partial [Candidatus Acidoferrales bacterium]|nr:hypothetical protein [Candidatus Acidoferrales bacterium]
MSMSETRWVEWLRWGMLLGATAWSTFGAGQEPANRTQPPSASDSVRELREQVRELQAAVAGMRSDWQRARTETAELRRELEEVRAGTGRRNAVLRNAVAKSEPGKSEAAAESLQSALQKDVPQDQATEDQKKDEKEDQKKAERAARLEEEYQLLSGKVDDQYQTKVESASKYRVRLSGIVLMNLASNQGTVDSIDLPTLAYARPP